MKMQLEIDLDNSAFKEPNQGYEVARILQRIISTMEQEFYQNSMKEGDGASLFDFNGNKVGKWEIV